MIRLLTKEDLILLEHYLFLQVELCMFICSNLSAEGIVNEGRLLQGDYFGYFKQDGDSLLGLIVHYNNGIIMMLAQDFFIIKELVSFLKIKMNRSIAGVLGPSEQAALVIKELSIPDYQFKINLDEELYEINLLLIDDEPLLGSYQIFPASHISQELLLSWLKSYECETLGATEDTISVERITARVAEWQKKDCWVLCYNGEPVSLAGCNARLPAMIQIGPVWTPVAYRNKGFARLLVKRILLQEKKFGVKKAILFTNNPIAVRVYTAVGFKKIGNYRLALIKDEYKKN